MSTNILVRLLAVNMKNCLTPTPKMCDPILVTLLKMLLHYTQTSRGNATPSRPHIPKSNRDSVRKAREAYLIERGKTLEPLGINKKDEM